MLIIQSNELLLQYIPNTIATVKGETSLFDKMVPFLETSEKWFSNNILGETILEDIANSEMGVLHNLVCQAIVYDAFHTAVPSLDLVLTPNGFGIVSNSNIAPASKERVERLMESLINMRDKAIEALLSELCHNEKWLATVQAEWFRSTLFPSLSLMRILAVADHRYDAYVATREQLLSIETHISASFIGDELMTELRKEAQSCTFAPMHESIIKMIQAVEVRLLKDSANNKYFASSCVPSYELRNIVNIIRNHPDEFTTWHNSSVAELFAPPIYENKKADKGYWF